MFKIMAQIVFLIRVKMCMGSDLKDPSQKMNDEVNFVESK